MKKRILLALMSALAICVFSSRAAVAPYDAEAAMLNARGDIQNWMSYLPDDMFVAHVSIPGTHDTATNHGWKDDGVKGSENASKTQEKTIDEQLEGGIRAFDYRPGLVDNTLYCNHGVSICNITFETALRKMTSYLDAHPGEFFIVHLFRGNVYANTGDASSGVKLLGGKDDDESRRRYNELFDQILNKGDIADYIVDFSPYLQVKDVRGKMIFFRRDRINFAFIEKAANIDFWTMQFDPNNPSNIINASNPAMAGLLHTQDVSSPGDSNDAKDPETNLDAEKRYCTALLDYSTRQTRPNDAPEGGDYKPFWVMNFTSGCNANGATNGTKGYKDNATIMHPLVLDYLADTNNHKGPMGIIYSDYVLIPTTKDGKYNVRGDELVPAIIENNFHYAADFMLDKEIFNHDPATEIDLFGGKTALLRNIGTGLLLDAGANWGTHATLSHTGFCVNPVYNSMTNAYRLKTTFTQNGSDNFIGPNYYVDNGSGREFNAVYSGRGHIYSFTYDDGGTTKAMTAVPTSGWSDDTEYTVDGAAFEKGNLMQQWEMITVEDYLAERAAIANPDNGQEVSFMIKGNKLDPNDSNNNAWIFTNVNGKYLNKNYVFGEIVSANDTENNKTLLYKAYSNKITGINVGKYSQWKLNQEVTGLPNGRYTLTCNMFACVHQEISMYVNGASKGIPHRIDYIPSNEEALNILRTEANCKNTLEGIIIEDGKLSIEFNKMSSNTSAGALFFSDMVLTYLGPTDMQLIEYTPSDEYDTIILPFDTQAPAGIGLYNSYVYREKAAKYYTLNQTTRESIKANTPYLVYSEPEAIGKTFRLWGVPVAAEGTLTEGLLTGSLSAASAPEDAFTLERIDDEHMAFVRKGAAVELPANRAYILDYEDEGINAPDSKINHLYIGGADTETIELTPQGLYSTFILPFAVDEIPAGMRVFSASAYVAKYEKEWILHLTEVDAIEANKPYIYTSEMGISSRAASASTFTFSGIPANDSDTYTQGVLTGSHVEHPVAAGEFIIKPTLDGSVFSRVTPDESFTLPAHSAYIADSEAADINHMLLDDYLISTGTKINMVSVDDSVEVYSTAGVLLRSGVRAADALHGLAPGLYLLRSATAVTKVARR